jgi:hypothetical protein
LNIAYGLKFLKTKSSFYYLAEIQRIRGNQRIVRKRSLGTAEKIQNRWEGISTEEFELDLTSLHTPIYHP